MNRLTRKEKWIDICDTKHNYNSDDNYCIEKLGELEDIEEELGISLPILFKALKNGIYIKQDDVGVHSSPRLYFSYDYKCYCFEICFGAWVVKLKDYGKTWWLKEDLKSE